MTSPEPPDVTSATNHRSGLTHDHIGGHGRARVAVIKAREDGSVGAAFELLRAVDSGELTLEYQPVFDLATSEVCRVEALVRWTHPDHGLLLPGAFLPSAMQPGIADVLNAF